MILLDFSPVVISRYSAVAYGSEDSYNIDIDLIRFTTLKAIAYINSRFRNKYGELVIAIDSLERVWRKDIFPYYKQNRKDNKSKSKMNWNQLHQYINQLKEELINYFNYKVLEISHAEADDVIGALSKYCVVSGERCLIVSQDKDFLQLQINNDIIQQYDISNDIFLSKDDPSKFIFEQVLRGDSADGIPNILSPIDSFITKTRQKRLTQKKIDEYWNNPSLLKDNDRYELNKKLIVLKYMPEEIRNNILNKYHTYSNTNKDIVKYFVEFNQKKLFEQIGDFK